MRISLLLLAGLLATLHAASLADGRLTLAVAEPRVAAGAEIEVTVAFAAKTAKEKEQRTGRDTPGNRTTLGRGKSGISFGSDAASAFARGGAWDAVGCERPRTRASVSAIACTRTV